MKKPNFAMMSTPELKAYVLQYRDDDDAFYALADRVHSDGINVETLDQLAKIVTAKQKKYEQ